MGKRPRTARADAPDPSALDRTEAQLRQGWLWIGHPEGYEEPGERELRLIDIVSHSRDPCARSTGYCLYPGSDKRHRQLGTVWYSVR